MESAESASRRRSLSGWWSRLRALRGLAGGVLARADQRALVSATGVSANAGVVLWQNRVRVGFVAGAVIVLLAFWSIGVLAAPPPAIWLILGGYAAALVVIGRVVRRRGRAGLSLLVTLTLCDLAVIFGSVGLLAVPPNYASALLLSLVALQFAHAFLDVAPSLLVVSGTVAGYVALVTATADRAGEPAPGALAHHAWMLLFYLGVAVNAIALQSRFNRRLGALVGLFSLAERGDFSRAYDEHGDHAEDGLTLVGRAYNHLRAELAALVLTDALTGCLNRRGFEQELAREVARTSRTGGELALLAVDIDHFKRINDSFGHLAGDTVLRELADVLAASARAGDVVGRVGGDELVILLPGADAEMAGVVAERVSNVVRGHQFITTRSRERVTVSIGIAAEQLTDPWMNHALRARADEALYVAKRLGRDRVMIWAPGIRSQATPPYLPVIGEGDALPGMEPARRIERAD